jgi:hypothetical protein
MDDPRTVDGCCGQLVRDGGLYLPVGRGLGLADVDGEPCFSTQAVQILDEALDSVGAARGENDHAELPA